MPHNLPPLDMLDDAAAQPALSTSAALAAAPAPAALVGTGPDERVRVREPEEAIVSAGEPAGGIGSLALPPTERALSPMERALWLLDQGTPFNGVQVVTLRGPMSEALLRAGLVRMQARHPLMRARVIGDERAPRFTDQGAAPLPLTTLRRTGDQQWLQAAEEEMNRPFLLGADHLTRLTLLLGAGRSELILSHHHVTGDALSVIYALRDLLHDLGAMVRGVPLPPLDPQPLLPPLGRLLPQEARGLNLYVAANAFFAKHVLLAPLRRARRLPVERDAPPAARQLRLGHRALFGEDVHRLRERARAEGASVHAVICAALLLSATDEAFQTEQRAGRSTTLGCFTAVNLRDKLTPAVGEGMGNFISQVTTFHRVVPTPPLWELARAVKSGLASALRWGEHYLTMPMLGLFIPWGQDPAARFIKRFDGASPAALGVTNLAKLPIPRDYEPFTVENYQLGVGCSVVGRVLGAVTTFGERLNLNLVFVEPLVSRPRAERILDGALERLRLAAVRAEAA